MFCSAPFQFHKGTIRTDMGRAVEGIVLLFQFHKGTIRTSHKRRNINRTIISIP